MPDRVLPFGYLKAKEIAARLRSPVGKPCAASKKGGVCKLYLYDAIGKDSWTGEGIAPQDVVAILNDAKDATSLEVHVNSPGGYVFDGIAIYNAIRGFNGTKTVYVDGIAASIASVIALAGDTVITNEGGTWMIHEPAGGIFSFGTADEIEDDARKTCAALRKVRETLLDIYVNATGQKLSDISAWMADETWMTAAEAKARGFTDEVAKSDPEPDPDDPDEPEEPKEKARAQTFEEQFATARADYAALRAKFNGASPAQQPGQPGTNSTKPAPRQKDATR